MEAGKKIVVPWDFTDVAQNALAHAVKIAKVLDNSITLLHIAKADKDKDEATDCWHANYSDDSKCF